MGLFDNIYKKKNQTTNPKKPIIPEDLVCYCYRIRQPEIEEIIHKHNCKTVEEVQMYCQASSGCGGCRPDVEELIQKILGIDIPKPIYYKRNDSANS